MIRIKRARVGDRRVVALAATVTLLLSAAGEAQPVSRGAAEHVKLVEAILRNFETNAPAIGAPMPDAVVYDRDGRELRLLEVLRDRYTVLILGCLTWPAFLNNVSRVETIERDYTPKGVQFYYLYKQLAHPELSNYVDPFTLDERLMHVAQAETQLGSRIPWIVDAMTNALKHALGDMANAEFVVDPEGIVVARRAWSNPAALRRDLERLVGPVENPTQVSDLDLPEQQPIPTVAKGIVPRVGLPGRTRSAQIDPQLQESEVPFYTKLRADVDQSFLRTGGGKLYLGFHIDPLYLMHWNNEAPPLEYAITAPDGVQVAPTTGVFPMIEEPADADPREFLLDIRVDDRTNLENVDPLDLSVTYYACDDANTFCIPVTQRYVVHLEVNPDAGRVRHLRGVADGMMTWDANNDGVITRDELPEQMDGMLDRFDTNGDDVIDEGELQAMTERVRQRLRH